MTEPIPSIHLHDRESLLQIADAMSRRQTFVIVTDDELFHPLGTDRHSTEVWVGALGGGMLITVGAGALVLAFMDPEPTTKLGLLVSGGILVTLAGGGVILTILVTRSGYRSVMRVNSVTGHYEWLLTPK